MFVPPSANSLLLQKITEAEQKLDPDMEWKVKLVEQSGFPLGMCFIPKFPLLPGCPRGEGCIVCGNTAVKCNKKGVIYKASCKACKFERAPVIDAKKKNVLITGITSECPITDVNADATSIVSGNSGNDARSVGVNGMNKIPNIGGEGEKRTVGVNGMNNNPSTGGG